MHFLFLQYGMWSWVLDDIGDDCSSLLSFASWGCWQVKIHGTLKIDGKWKNWFPTVLVLMTWDVKIVDHLSPSFLRESGWAVLEECGDKVVMIVGYGAKLIKIKFCYLMRNTLAGCTRRWWRITNRICHMASSWQVHLIQQKKEWLE